MPQKDKVVVTIGNDVSSFGRILAIGAEADNSDVRNTLFYGYDELTDFVEDFSTIMITTYKFLMHVTDNPKVDAKKAFHEIVQATLKAIDDDELEGTTILPID